MTYEPRWSPQPGAWVNLGRLLFDHHLQQQIGGDWDPKLRDEFLDREWDRVQGELNQPVVPYRQRWLYWPGLKGWAKETEGRKLVVQDGEIIYEKVEDWDPERRDEYLDELWAELWAPGPDTAESHPRPNWDLPGSLMQWWMETAERDCEAATAKLGEYGSFDLLVVGQMLAHMAGWDDATDAQLTELGTWFYLCGKIARGYDAVREHRLPSDDTVHDIKVYATMIERIRQHGSWA